MGNRDDVNIVAGCFVNDEIRETPQFDEASPPRIWRPPIRVLDDFERGLSQRFDEHLGSASIPLGIPMVRQLCLAKCLRVNSAFSGNSMTFPQFLEGPLEGNTFHAAAF
jgi:hypothetical protein